MSAKLTFDTLGDLREAIAMVATARGSAAARFTKVQAMVTDNADVARLAKLPAGQFRSALTRALEVVQTLEGKRYPSCILCRSAVSDEKGKTHPSAPALITLVASSLLADKDALEDASPGSAPRLGWLPGNIALACRACSIWKASADGRDVILSADIIPADLVLLSWVGIKQTKIPRSDDYLESMGRRARARDLVLGR